MLFVETYSSDTEPLCSEKEGKIGKNKIHFCFQDTF